MVKSLPPKLVNNVQVVDSPPHKGKCLNCSAPYEHNIYGWAGKNLPYPYCLVCAAKSAWEDSNSR